MTQVYKCLHELAPEKLSKQLTQKANVGPNETAKTHRTTRSCTRGDLTIPNLKLEASRKSFCYRGPMMYNMIDTEIRNSDTLAQFKSRLLKSDMFTAM